MDLISQLKQDHVEILRLFLDKELVELKDFLITHLDLENKMLYPALAKCLDKEPRELSMKFSKEMLGIAEVVMAFFDKYEKTDVKKLVANDEFMKEYTTLIDAVKKRIAVEEKILFPAYQKYVKG